MLREFDRIVDRTLRDASSGSSAPGDLRAFETKHGLTLPADARAFLSKFGPLRVGGLTVVAPDGRFTIGDTLTWLQFLQPSIPVRWIPLAVLATDRVVCIDKVSSDLVVVDPLLSPTASGAVRAGTTYDLEVCARIVEEVHRERACERLLDYVAKFQKEYPYDHAAGGSLPRSHRPRPIRYCIQDVVFGVVVVRQQRGKDGLQVDLFIAEDVPEYLPDAGAEALLMLLLSEAWRLGTSMDLEFGKDVENGSIPGSIRRIAHKVGVSLESMGSVITAEAARSIYVRSTGFDAATAERIDDLRRTGRMSPERACFAVHSGVWTRPEVGHIVASAGFPDAVLSGQRQAVAGLLWLQDLCDAAGAVLGGSLDARLRLRPAVARAADLAQSDEDAFVDLSVSLDPTSCSMEYMCAEMLEIPWVASAGSRTTLGKRSAPKSNGEALGGDERGCLEAA
jgi:hypothetical protein